MVFVLWPCVCFCLQAVSLFMMDDLDGVACIFGVINFDDLRQPDCFAFERSTLCTLAISCEDIRYLMLRQRNLMNFEDFTLDR